MQFETVHHMDGDTLLFFPHDYKWLCRSTNRILQSAVVLNAQSSASHLMSYCCQHRYTIVYVQYIYTHI